jgi:hypothetical protein
LPCIFSGQYGKTNGVEQRQDAVLDGCRRGH